MVVVFTAELLGYAHQDGKLKTNKHNYLFDMRAMSRARRQLGHSFLTDSFLSEQPRTVVSVKY